MIISIFAISFVVLVASIVFGAVYVPSTDWAIEEMLDLAKVKKGERLLDLGSGNGKVLIAAARRGAIAYGYEINPLLVLWSYFLIWRAGVWGKAHPRFGNFFSVDFSSFAVITIFVVPYVMPKIEKKVFTQAKKGTRIVVETFPFKKHKPQTSTKSVHLYVV